ncbi:MAG: sodium:calcium antiporter [Nitrospirae bacterium]|nr:MAG: sodium:calcium antiporter [Nitrospirota bacterium]
MLVSLLLFLVAIGVILGGAAVFTNGVEWMGRRLGISDGAIGSILAGVATALPETLIPVIAIFFGDSKAEADIGTGAILGAPLMLSTLTIPLMAGFLLFLAAMRKRADHFTLDYHAVRLDLQFFLPAYGAAFLVALMPVPALRYATAAGLFLMYLWYVKIHLAHGEVSEVELEPLYFARKAGHPATALVAAQAVVGLGLLVGGAHLFVHAVEDVALGIGVSPLILSLLVAPIATELPEKMNSLLWIYQKKDTLAVGNITGAMVFQGTFPVSVGLLGTGWNLDQASLISILLPIAATGFLLALIHITGKWQPRLLVSTAALYAGYIAYLFLR